MHPGVFVFTVGRLLLWGYRYQLIQRVPYQMKIVGKELFIVILTIIFYNFSINRGQNLIIHKGMKSNDSTREH